MAQIEDSPWRSSEYRTAKSNLDDLDLVIS
jgi:hypothetical protein